MQNLRANLTSQSVDVLPSLGERERAHLVPSHGNVYIYIRPTALCACAMFTEIACILLVIIKPSAHAPQGNGVDYVSCYQGYHTIEGKVTSYDVIAERISARF